ncbi:MAG TPA: ABC transporter ATP-binding protein [Patescibacteria group bacterium]|nr:ABC transporter ATP-binding protein [Patescibacteria group bacterium]
MSSAKKSLGFIDVLKYAAGYWKRQPVRLGIVLIFLLIGAFIETYLPTALSNFLGAIRQEAQHEEILRALFIFLGAYLLQALVFSFTYLCYNVFETHVFKQVLDDGFAHVYSLPEPYFSNTFMGAIISKISRARVKIETFEDQIILRIFPTAVVLIGTIAFLALRFPMLAALMTVYLLVLAVASIYLVFRVSGPAQGVYADAQDHFGAHLADSVNGIATAKAYAQEPSEVGRFVNVTEALRVKNVRAYLLGNTAAFLQRLLLTGMLALLLGGGTWYLFQGRATVESMAYLAFAYNILQSYIRELGENIKNLLTSSYDLHAIIDIMREPAEVADNPGLPALDIRHGAIAFENATFTYPGKERPIFRDFLISIRAGERVALVGHSGSGKTTFVRLLQQMYRLQNGRITVDGQDITQGSRHSLRSAIALVPQDPILFHRSLADNIAYGRPGASAEDIRSAARQAHIDEFIMQLPQQYDTLVGERGIKLSGGERQRIAIARAILADRPILILDEATSSLDSESERAIQDALYALTHGRTSIMIAHRLSTILDADRIIVFEEGQIVEEGTHDELVAKPGGIYAGFFRLQSGGFITE